METTLTGTLETRSDSEPLSVKVVRKVARMEGVDPTELDAPLYDVINPEALDELFEPRRNGEPRFGAVTFTYHGYDIVVEHGDDDGGPTITLEDSGASPGSTNGSGDRSGGDSAPNASHYCLDCDWKLDDEGYSTSERSGLAITHHVETGHTVEAADSDERSASSDAVEEASSPVDALEDAEDEPAVAVSDDSVVTN